MVLLQVSQDLGSSITAAVIDHPEPHGRSGVAEPGNSFYQAAGASRSRGAAAGPINPKSKYWRKRKIVKNNGWWASYENEQGKESKMRVNNTVFSSVVGYFEATPFAKVPCRMTSYTQKYFQGYRKGIPFLQAIDRQFQKLVPAPYRAQQKRIKSTPAYRIADTAFSSVTINRNFRTALHKDAGDFKDGYGNLTVLERGKYHGGETLFPQYGIGIDLRAGDFVAMDVHEWHTNTPLVETAEDKAYNKTLPDIRSRDPAVGVAGSTDRFQRLSFVCYYRDKIMECEEAETKAYYKKEGFDEKEAVKEAKDETPVSLPLPGVTATLEETWKAFEETSAGKAARMLQTRKHRQKTDGTRRRV
jgi:hypothetical protein